MPIKRTLIPLVLLALAGWAAGAESIILATTTSTQDSGLLDVLVPAFEKQSGIEVKVIAVGTGAALKMAETGDADAVLAHAPEAEQKCVEAGHLVDGCAVMHNDFVILGPKNDPAGVRAAKTTREAMKAIATNGGFISRGDDSGTHKLELKLWKAAGIDPKSIAHREETGQGMGNTLMVAAEKQSYTISDRGTWRALASRLDLAIVSQGDPSLLNSYHAYVVNPEKHPKVRAVAAKTFVDYLVSAAGQQVIASFKVDGGAPLFTPDAAKAPAKE